MPRGRSAALAAAGLLDPDVHVPQAAALVDEEAELVAAADGRVAHHLRLVGGEGLSPLRPPQGSWPTI